LKAYANQEDQQVLMSKLRLIVDDKFEEAQFFLWTIAFIFYAFLISYMYLILVADVPVWLTITLIGLNTFFFLLELKQVFMQGARDYLSDFWNYIDISVFVMNYYIFISGKRGSFDKEKNSYPD
jgi:hypothetical protein